MSLLPVGFGGKKKGAPNVANSLRFNGTNSSLNRSFGSGNQKKWSYSAWVKPSKFAATQYLMGIYSAANDYAMIAFSTAGFINANDTLRISCTGGGGGSAVDLVTSAQYRDPSSWLHVCIAVDTAQAVAADRVVVNVNGVKITSFGTATYPNQNADLWKFNSAVNHYLMSFSGVQAFDGYLSNATFIDGQALAPTAFGFTDPSTGQWVSKSKADLTTLANSGGANSFFLPFDNGTSTTTLGADTSSKGNNWFLTNMVRDGGVNDCWMLDTPTNNFATLNPLDFNAGTISNGALTFNGNGRARATQSFATKTYVEWQHQGTGAAADVFGGLIKASAPITSVVHANPGANWYVSTDKLIQINGATAGTVGGPIVAADRLQLAYDPATGNGWLGINGTWYSSAGAPTGNPATGLNPTFTMSSSDVWSFYMGVLTGGGAAWMNFGQVPVAGGQFYTEAGGYFRYAPPAGFKALCTKNLPVPAIKLPKKHFGIKLRNGTGALVNVTGLDFQPDFVWIKSRSNAYDHHWFDAIRGPNKVLYSDLTSAEVTQTQALLSFNPDGYTLGTSSDSAINNSGLGQTFVDWSWKAGGAPVANNAGSIPSQVSANPLAGFSIVTWTNPASGGYTVGHGLGKQPGLIIVKERDATIGWPTWHIGLTGGAANSTYSVLLNSTAAQSSTPSYWGASGHTADTIGMAVPVSSNANKLSVAYCFAEVAGFSKMGSYAGNGSADGPFINCGFKPAYLMIKRTDAAYDWYVHDAARDPSNPSGRELYPNSASAEVNSSRIIDLVSNGFKIRDSNPGINNGQYVFIAFAESPFKYANGR